MLQFPAMLVSRSPELLSALTQAMESTGLQLAAECDATRAVLIAREQNVPVILATTDVDWRSLIAESYKETVPPSILLLMPSPDPQLWAEALSYGAFDALAASADPGILLECLSEAYRRWMRKRLAREELERNPLGHTSHVHSGLTT